MSDAQTMSHAPVIVTQNAARKFGELIAVEEQDNLSLRIAVNQGCDGPEIEFSFADAVGVDDIRFDQQDVTFLVDSQSANTLEGVVVDYIEGVDGAEFLVKGLEEAAGGDCGCDCGCND